MKKQKEKKRQAADPNRAREANKYQNPIASREFIHQLLVDEGAPLSFKSLIQRLGFEFDPDLQEALRRRLGCR